MLVSLFADASYHESHSAGGWGAWVRSERGRAYNGGAWLEPIQSSTMAEFLAICEGVEMALRSQIALPGDHILIQSDCQGLKRWFYNDTILIPASIKEKYLHRTGKLNTYEGDMYYKTLQMLNNNHLKVELRHVKGHSTNDTTRNYVNNLCDRLAAQGSRNAKVCRSMSDPDKRVRVHRRYLHVGDKVDYAKVLPGDVEGGRQTYEVNGKVMIKF